MINNFYKNQEYIVDLELNLSLPKTVHFCELKDTLDLFSVKLICSEEISNIEICFDSVVSYRSADEGSRMRFLDECPDGILGDKILIGVKNSQYLNWFMNECHHIYDESELNHYIIITSDSIIDVLTYEKPQIILK
tara:strand:- start:143 stop:550 length:408 start_codon:yes stop_codon:yes gene_type:complete